MKKVKECLRFHNDIPSSRLTLTFSHDADERSANKIGVVKHNLLSRNRVEFSILLFVGRVFHFCCCLRRNWLLIYKKVKKKYIIAYLFLLSLNRNREALNVKENGSNDTKKDTKLMLTLRFVYHFCLHVDGGAPLGKH